MHSEVNFFFFLFLKTFENGLRLDKLDCRKLTYENNANTDALKVMEKLRTLAKFNENLKFCNF
jgi:hypothetical protein